jgi:hypothetical protein
MRTVFLLAYKITQENHRNKDLQLQITVTTHQITIAPNPYHLREPLHTRAITPKPVKSAPIITV